VGKAFQDAVAAIGKFFEEDVLGAIKDIANAIGEWVS
jgi:hypothetical protein